MVTPVQELDEAVQRFRSAIAEDDDGSALSGWVLVYQTSRLVNEDGIDPVVWAGGYSMAPGLSPFAAVGLCDYLSEIVRAHAHTPVEDED